MSSLGSVGVIAALGLGIFQSPDDAPQPAKPTYSSRYAKDAYYDITIDYAYRGHVFHKTWVHHCFFYTDAVEGEGYFTRGRWPGVAVRLPDGSAAFFQFRNDVCGATEIGRLVLGEKALKVLWGDRLPIIQEGAWGSAGGEQLNAEFKTWVDGHPNLFVSPAIYWLDDAKKPSKVELCGPVECVTSPDARVRFLGIRGSVSSSRVASNPTDEVPGLKGVGSGDKVFVGYACWRIPMSVLTSVPELKPFFEYGGYSNKNKTGGSNTASSFMQIVKQQNVAFMNNQIGNGAYQFTPIADNDYRKAWSRRVEIASYLENIRVSCRRDGSAIHLEVSLTSPANAITMTLLDRKSYWPTTFYIKGQKPISTDVTSSKNVSEATYSGLTSSLTTDAIGKDRAEYLAEAVILSLDQPRE